MQVSNALQAGAGGSNPRGMNGMQELEAWWVQAWSRRSIRSRRRGHAHWRRGCRRSHAVSAGAGGAFTHAHAGAEGVCVGAVTHGGAGGARMQAQSRRTRSRRRSGHGHVGPEEQ